MPPFRSRLPGSLLHLVFNRLGRLASRLEQCILSYFTATAPRRRLARISGALLFACMTVAMMGGNGCTSCFQTPSDVSPAPDIPGSVLSGLFLGLGNLNSIGGSTRVRPRFLGTDGSQTGTASFLGNFTGITQSSGSYFVMLRGSDCSLFKFVGSSALNGSFTFDSFSANYERTLHQVASLTTTADTYPHGCTDHSTSISSRVAVALARKSASPVVLATVQPNGANNAVFVLSLHADLTAIHFAPLSGLATASSLTTADLNGDGNGDLVVVNNYNAGSAFISVLLGNGDGTFSASVTYATAGNSSVAATVADINGDGKLDIVAVSDDQNISVLLGNGNGSFQAAQSFAAPALPGFVSSASTPILGLMGADLNGDGKQDIICSNGLVFLGSSAGTLTAVSAPAFPYANVSPGGFGPGLAAGDLNNDGKLDLVVDSGTTISTWTGRGDGTFASGSSYASINNSGYVTVTDLDGDGNYDIYAGLAGNGIYTGDDNAPASAYVLMGNGDGTFVGAPQVIGRYNGANLGDVNGDGVPDLITNSSSGVFTVQLGSGHGSFTTASTFTAPSSFSLSGYTFSNAATFAASSYAVADVNGDGKADLLFVDNGLTAQGLGLPITYSYPVYFVALSNGNGTFQTPVPYAFPQIAPSSGFDNTLIVRGLQIDDFDHNGKNDLVFTYYDQAGGTGVNPYLQGFVVLTGNGDGTFNTVPALTSTYSSTSAPTTALLPTVVSTADLNTDLRPDITVIVPSFSIPTGAVTQLVTYIGNGDGTFKTGVPLPLSANVYGLPVVLDLNKDGKLDAAFLAETSASQAELVVALGNGDGTFRTPMTSNLTGGDAIRSAGVAAADFDGDTNIDLALFDTNDYSGVFYGKGDGTFTSVPATGYIVPKDLFAIAAGGPSVAAELTKDAHPDVLAGTTVLVNLYGSAPITAISTTTALISSASSIAPGAGITFIATVTPATGTTAPTGTVTFVDGASTLGTGTLNGSGVAALTTTALSASGAHTITAVYAGASGNPGFNGSTSVGVAVTVAAPPNFAVSLSASTTTVTHGNAATTTVSVTPSGGFTTAVAVTCTGAPANSICSVAPGTITPIGTGAATATVTLQTSVTTGSLSNLRRGVTLAALPVALLSGLALFAATRRQRRIWVSSCVMPLVALTALCGLLAAGGCGGSSSKTTSSTLTTAPGTYNLTLTATSGTTVHSTGWTVTVQ